MTNQPISLEELLKELRQVFPEYTYQILYSPYKLIVVRKSRFSGVEISLVRNGLRVSYTIPAWRRFLNMNENAILLLVRFFVKDAFQPLQQIARYIQDKYGEVMIHSSQSAY